MCGIIGISGNSNIASALIKGLNSLQHRGQDAAGIVIADTELYVKKGLGLVDEIFNLQSDYNVTGTAGIGHVRYTTQGVNKIENAQPFLFKNPMMAMAHNGNITNFQELKDIITKHGKTIDTDGDIELLAKMFAIGLTSQNNITFSPQQLFDAIKFLYKEVHGAYAALVVIKDHGLLGFTDQHGIRPLFLGKKETKDGATFCFSSESVTFDILGFKIIKRLAAGEVIFISNDNKIYTNKENFNNYRPCIFEDIYFSNKDSKALSLSNNSLSIAEKRIKLGRLLAKHMISYNLTPDVIIDVPSSAYFYAKGLAEALNIPYKRGLEKNHSLRTFITDEHNRSSVVSKKFNIITDVIQNKKVCVVDDSIVRGTISKHIVAILREAGAKEIYFVSAAPMITNPCIYGIDISSKKEMIAHKRTADDIALLIGADHVVYLTLEDLYNFHKNVATFCDACFSGKYPTKISRNTFKSIQQEKQIRTTNA